METFVFRYHVKPGSISKHLNVKEAWAIIWTLADNIENAEKKTLNYIAQNNWVVIASLEKSLISEAPSLPDKVNHMHYNKAQELGISMRLSTIPFPQK